MDPWLLSAIAFASGLVIGALIIWFVSLRNRGGGENARRLRREFDRYRQAVDEHFAETAELANAFDQSYRAFYGHLERGASKLIDRDASRSARREADPMATPLPAPPLPGAIPGTAAPETPAPETPAPETATPDAPPRREPGAPDL